MMPPALRRLVLTVHVIASVGWLGAVVTYLIFSVVAAGSDEPTTVQAIARTLDVGGWTILVPFSVGSLISGVVLSLGTRWGLLQHYWVVFKLVLTVVASVVLVLYTETLTALAKDAQSAARDAMGFTSPILHAAGAALMLIGATVLSVYKPVGLTRRGQRRIFR